MLTLVATPGASDANTYSTLVEGDSYHDTLPPETIAAWDDADDDTKSRALLTATRVIDDEFTFLGASTSDTQRLAWPRTGMTYVTGADIPDDVIPDGLRDATAEFARQLLENAERLKDNDIEKQGITALKAGPVELEFSRPPQSSAIPDAVARMLTRWVEHVSTGPRVRTLIRA